MLRCSADIRTLIFMAVTTALFVGQWQLGSVQPVLYVVYLYLSIAVTTIAHNHNHVPIWRNSRLNALTDYWLTVFYGFPAFAWIPTHNQNHHTLNNREGDYTITWRITENNVLWMLLIYPSVSSYYQQKPIRDFLKATRATNTRRYWFYLSQYALLAAWIGAALLIDWRKALLYVVIPQQVGLYAVLVFNYVQHVHTDANSAWNHSRNFVGWLNLLLFNNGFHTVHHERAGTHWSKTPAEHAKVATLIDPALIERSFWWYILRVYFLGIFIPKFRTHSMRPDRIEGGTPMERVAS